MSLAGLVSCVFAHLSDRLLTADDKMQFLTTLTRLTVVIIVVTVTAFADTPTSDSETSPQPKASGIPSDQSRKEFEDFPEDDSLRNDRLGLFIGICSYKKSPLVSPVRDALNIREIFQSRFGFQRTSLVTDQHATREGLRKAMLSLVREVEKSRARLRNKKKINVVIFYAGHGSQVKDQPNGDERNGDGLDETWVTVEGSGANGKNDIRDDDLHAVINKLLSLNAEVMLISDSCHSGSIHRGNGLARILKRPNVTEGATSSLFPEFDSHDLPANTPGFISFSACRDGEVAYEDERGGRFTTVLIDVLTHLEQEASYHSMFQRLSSEFAQRWAGTQTPQLHAASDFYDQRFLRGGHVAAHATIIPDSRKGDRLQISYGHLHGSSVGARVDFYKSLDELSAGAKSIAVGTVIRVDPLGLRSTVKVEGIAHVPATAKCRLDSVKMTDFKIHIPDDVPTVARDVIASLAKKDSVQLVKTETAANVALLFNNTSNVLSLYSTEGFFADRELLRNRHPIETLKFNPSLTGDEAVAQDEILKAFVIRNAGAYRLFSLKRNEHELSWRIKPRRLAKGVPRVVSKKEFTIEFTNLGKKTLYLTLLNLGEGDFVLYPDPNEDPADPRYVLSPMSTTTLPFMGVTESGVETNYIKVIATEQPIAHMVRQLKRHNQDSFKNSALSRGQFQGFGNFLSGAIYGGRSHFSRGQNAAAQEPAPIRPSHFKTGFAGFERMSRSPAVARVKDDKIHWATALIRFEVEPN